MGKGLNELGLLDEKMPTAGQELADLPDFGRFTPPPQPGPFRFKLPQDMSTIWEPIETPQLKPPQRVRAVFDRDHPLLIIQSLNKRYDGEPFETRLSNQERARGKDKSIIASDMDYLLRALGVLKKPASNQEYIRTLQQQSGKEFSADLRYSWVCSPDRNKRIKRADGTIEEVQEKGCGDKYYQEDVPKLPSGEVPYEITCGHPNCGASLRAFGNLDNIRA